MEAKLRGIPEKLVKKIIILSPGLNKVHLISVHLC